MLLRLLITILVGAAGAWVLYKLKVPAGAMVGAIIAVGIFQIATGYGYFPRPIKICVQAIAGGFLGQRISRRDLREIRLLIKPALELFFGIVCLSMTTGLLIHHFSPLDTVTSLLASIPGGVSDSALMAEDLGADPTRTTALQLIRYLLAILILPQVDGWLCRRFAPEASNPPSQDGLSKGVAKKKDWKHLLITLAIITAAGAAGYISRFPAGAIVFPMFAVAGYNIRTEQAYLPKPMKLVAQCFAGVNIGVLITLRDILQFRELLLPAFFVAANCILTNYLLGFLIYKTNKKLDLPTCLFAAVPAGLSDMALISMEQGGDAPKVAALQLVRYLCVMAFMPSFIKFFSMWYPF